MLLDLNPTASLIGKHKWQESQDPFSSPCSEDHVTLDKSHPLPLSFLIYSFRKEKVLRVPHTSLETFAFFISLIVLQALQPTA